MPGVRQGEAARVTRHVRMDWKWHASALCRGARSARGNLLGLVHRAAALGSKYMRARRLFALHAAQGADLVTLARMDATRSALAASDMQSAGGSFHRCLLKIAQLAGPQAIHIIGFASRWTIAVQVLCPMHRGRRRSTQTSNSRPHCARSRDFAWTFAPGDKVMQIENDYDKEVYNGDIGFVADVEPEEGELSVKFDGRSVSDGHGVPDTLVPAYAASIHKSQGSEYPAVVIPVMTQHYAMLRRNLLYTGVTRGKKLVVLVGQKKAVAIAARNISGRRRWSKLQEWLSADVSKRYVSA